MTFKERNQERKNVWKDYSKQGTIEWTYEIASHDLQYQIGALTKAILQLKNYRYAHGFSKEELLEKIADEIADTIANVLFIADELDIDVDKAWKNMLESDINKIKDRS